MAAQVTLVVDTDGGGVPLDALARALDGLRLSVLWIGHMLGRGGEPSRGAFAAQFRRECELVVAEVHPGSVELVLEPPPPDQTQLPLGMESRLGEQALERFMQLVDHFASEEPRHDLAELLPQASHRELVLRTFKGLCPPRSAGAVVKVGRHGQKLHQLDSSARLRLLREAARPSSQDVLEERQIVAKLARLDATGESREFAVEWRDRVFKYPHDDELRDALLGLYEDDIVVQGLFRVLRHDDDEDELLELVGLIDVAAVDLSPVVADRFVHGGASWVLDPPLELKPKVDEWGYRLEDAELTLAVFGRDRTELARDLFDDLVFVWEAYAQRPDDELSDDAVRLKHAVLARLTREVA